MSDSSALAPAGATAAGQSYPPAPAVVAVASAAVPGYVAREERNQLRWDIRRRYGEEQACVFDDLVTWLAGGRRFDDDGYDAWLIYDRAGSWWREIDEDACYAVRLAARPWLERVAARIADCRAGLIPPEDGTWWGHLAWLDAGFGDTPFTVRTVREAALAGGKFIAPPPYQVRATRLHEAHAEDFDPDGPVFGRRLGKVYGQVVGQEIDGWLTLRQDGGRTDNLIRWWVDAQR